MLQQLINHSPDLKQLRDEGYEIEYSGGYLLIHHIPYVNNNKEIKHGTLVSELTLVSNTKTAAPANHVIYFIGEHPCNKDGSIITSIKHTSQNKILHEGVIINHSFSNKPANGYANYYFKVSRYADIISAQAKALDNSVTEKTFKVVHDNKEDSVFQYPDTNSSRANINLINSKFNEQKIAIIGLGGTGAYILDLVAKTPVQEIHLFDGDVFFQHNAFRSPGAASNEQLDRIMKKVIYYSEIYSKMHKNIIPHIEYITDDNINCLDQMSFVFICVDKNSARKIIIDNLLKTNVPFIDVGLGVNVVDDKLIGTLRVTNGSSIKNDHLINRVPMEENDVINEYATNIQIADLNSFNASLAVIKWKKIIGFYQDLNKEYHCSYSINNSNFINEDITA
ncbi:MAG: ThiF family adenylyltransferase [Bacteroidales bacterium]|nr:ThiF family adenylyltransferase [Bacteroidales bacterium]